MSPVAYRDALGKALYDSMKNDPKTIILGQNIAGYSLKDLTVAFGEDRVRDTSISESAMVGMAVGAAMKGLKVVVMIAYADITSVCHMAIVESAAKIHYLTCGRLNCSVLIRAPIGRFRAHGPEGNAVAASWFYNVPELNIAMPASADEAYGSFVHGLQCPKPTLFLEDRSLQGRTGDIGAENRGFRAAVTRPGDRLTIIAAGRTAALAEDAADQLATKGYNGAVQVVSLGFIKPLDRETTLNAVAKTGRVLILQDEPPWGGYAPYVRCLLDGLPGGSLAVPPRVMTGADEYLPYWGEQHFLPSLEGVMSAARDLMS